MPERARRPAARPLRAAARRALLLGCLWQGGTAAAESITAAHYADPTIRYAHAVLGDSVEHETLVLTLASGEVRRYRLPETSVFEDTAPRLADLDGDGDFEVLVVESDQSRGARLAVFDAAGRVTATPYIGTRYRWLAPLGAADLDGDGWIEVAYVDRPHLAKTLRIWRFENRRLVPVIDFPGVTNHRIGETDIAGGIRLCGPQPEMILADATWQTLLALTFDGQGIAARSIGHETSRAAFAAAMHCRDAPN